ncbi:MAG: DUF6441 family protein [Sphingomonas sp.]|nr:DUF6441 family protein [Sphingomonas sp.]MDX3885984.1 DUF6441 family protein [Sphingomonas sp.]
MADIGPVLTIDSAKLRRDADQLARAVLGAGADAVRSTTRKLERNLEEATATAIGGKLWRAWQSRAYPSAGPAQDPAGIITLKGRDRTRGAVAFFTQPGRIVGKRGQFLAIPTAAAGPRGRMRDLTPGEWERRTGQRLRFVYRRGRPSLLVTQGVANQRTGTPRPITRLRSAADQRRGYVRYEQTMVVFVLLPAVEFANRFAIEPMINAAEGDLAMEFFANVRGLSAR